MYADVSCRPGRAVYEEQGNETALETKQHLVHRTILVLRPGFG